MGKKPADIIVYDREQTKALEGLHKAMGGFGQAVIDCDAAGIPLADAFQAIGVEIPSFLRPMLNQLSGKLPSANGKGKSKSKDIVKIEDSSPQT